MIEFYADYYEKNPSQYYLDVGFDRDVVVHSEDEEIAKINKLLDDGKEAEVDAMLEEWESPESKAYWARKTQAKEAALKEPDVIEDDFTAEATKAEPSEPTDKKPPLPKW